jgi:hypothetical protein
MADFPSVEFTALELSSNTPTIVTTSISGLEQRSQVRTQYFNFTASFQNLSDAERREIMGFLMSKRGSLTPFSIDLPSPFNNSTGAYTGTITVTVGAAGATSVTATVASNVVIVKAGDFIKFSGHNKLYMVTADATASAGTVSISLFPALRTSAVSNTITHKTVPMYVRCSTDQLGFSAGAVGGDGYNSIDIDFVEVIQ